MVDVAPVGGCGAAGEHAVPVAALHGPADVGWYDPLGAAHVQRPRALWREAERAVFQDRWTAGKQTEHGR
jgi:hypothetical protein